MAPLESKLCPSCGNQIDADSRFCKHCASSLAAEAPSGNQVNRKSNQAIAVVALTVAVASLAILVVYIYNNRQSHTTISSFTSTQSNARSTTQVAPETPQSNSNGLTNERVLAAVQNAFNKLVQSNQMAPGANARVVGIQEIPAGNAAHADLDLTNAAFLQTDMLSGRWEVGPGGYGGRMVYSKKRIRIDHCVANLKQFNNGKWILESLDTQSYEFGVVKVNVTVDY